MAKGKGKPRKTSLEPPPSRPRFTTLSTEQWTIFWIDPGAGGTIVHIIETHIADVSDSAASGQADAPVQEDEK